MEAKTKVSVEVGEHGPWAYHRCGGSWQLFLHRRWSGEEGSVALVVDEGLDEDRRLELRTIGSEDLVSWWSSVRSLLGKGPLVTEVRDAIAACRRELDVRHPRVEHDGYREVQPRSQMEAFAEHVGAGMDPDAAAVAAGGTGRP